jgi:hypothetical protein
MPGRGPGKRRVSKKVKDRRAQQSRRIKAECEQIATAWDDVLVEGADPFWDGLRAEANRNAGKIRGMTEVGDFVLLGEGDNQMRLTVTEHGVHVKNGERDFGSFRPDAGDEHVVEDPAILALSDRGYHEVRAAFEDLIVRETEALGVG